MEEFAPEVSLFLFLPEKLSLFCFRDIVFTREVELWLRDGGLKFVMFVVETRSPFYAAPPSQRRGKLNTSPSPPTKDVSQKVTVARFSPFCNVCFPRSQCRNVL